jgi:hypothetical protein
VIARQINFSPFKHYLTNLSYNYLSPNLARGGNPIQDPPSNPQTKPPDPTLASSSYIINSWKESGFSMSTPKTKLLS